ncbi:hypothetical protein DOY81_005314, partial [Sarcophaga bullata]
ELEEGREKQNTMTSEKVTRFSLEAEKKKEPTRETKTSLGKSKKVVMGEPPPDTKSLHTFTHVSLYDRLMAEIDKILENRSKMVAYDTIDDQLVNVTPLPIKISFRTERFERLNRKYKTLQKVSDVGDIESFKSVTSSIGEERLILDLETSTRPSWHMVNLDSSSSSETGVPSVGDMLDTLRHPYPFVRIVLRKTELILLYEQHSMTAIKNTDDGNNVESDNKTYDFLTIGRGKVRRRSEAESQTFDSLLKSREVNTIRIKTCDVGTYVSYFEMYDTCKLLEDREYGNEWAEPKKLHMSQSQTPEEQFEIIAKLPSFHLTSVIMKRLLSSNVFEQGQRRFRNMTKVTRMADKMSYKYSVNLLFVIYPDFRDGERKAVADMSFCYKNSDILAVAYGIYSYSAAKQSHAGEVCIWSIKNPRDPERFYHYDVPVTSVEFSPYMPTLLAIGLFDGLVEVRDIAYYNEPPIAISARSSLRSMEPVLAIKWIKQANSNDAQEVDPFLTLSQDGSTTQFRIINSPFLAGFRQMTLQRIEGTPEGLATVGSSAMKEDTDPCPQGLGMTIHPTMPDIYYLLTDEGCVHKCSTNYQNHYLQVIRTHDAAVNAMDFSPWSPKLFLTCGNDWCIRIWMEGIFQPLITLKNTCSPYQWAAWSRIHCTVILAINRQSLEIWDIRRNILKPMSTTKMCGSHKTLGIFSLDGNSIAVGTERGNVLINALDDMPFPPYYQYDTLEKAIYNAVTNYPDLLIELKSVGYFGYPKKGYVKPP